MNLLLDTHTFLWFLNGSDELPEGIKELIIIQGKYENMAIVTKDEVFKDYDVKTYR